VNTAAHTAAGALIAALICLAVVAWTVGRRR
jgi:hypothetical protein